MGHQTHHVAALVDDARNVMNGTVDGLGVAEDDLVPRLQLSVEVLVGEPAALSVLHGDDQLPAFRAPRSERRVAPLDAHANVAADELERRVPAQHSREQPGLAEDLEAVADAEHESALLREVRDRLHRRREPCDCAAAQVVAVREAAGQDDGVEVGQLVVGVPDQ